MTAGDVVLVVAAIGAQLAILIPLWRQGAAAKVTAAATQATATATQVAVAQTQSDIADVKELTNGSHTALMGRVEQLQNTITAAGGSIPATLTPAPPVTPAT